MDLLYPKNERTPQDSFEPTHMNLHSQFFRVRANGPELSCGADNYTYVLSET
jgi:hypothetical protein